MSTNSNYEDDCLFPRNIHIDDVRLAIQGRSDFRECTYGDHSVFVYFLGMGNCCSNTSNREAKDIFPDPNTAPDRKTRYLWKLRRECRGIIFDTQSGRVLSRRFHKFFNVNETDETKVNNIKLDKPFVILEKLDGSMIAPYYTGGKLRFGTKNGITDTGKLAEEYIESVQHSIPYVEFSATWIAKGFTPIYEFCSAKNKIVLHYKDDSLNLIALRNMETGEYIPFQDTIQLARDHGIPHVKAWSAQQLNIDLSAISVDDFTQFYNKIQATKGVEGFVIRFEDGTMLKIKTHWYFDVNKSLDLVKNAGERYKWMAILNEQYDDLRPHLSEDQRAFMDTLERDIVAEIQVTAKSLLAKVEHAKSKMDRKQFAVLVNSSTRAEKNVLWKLWALLDSPEAQKLQQRTNDNQSQITAEEEMPLLRLFIETITKHVKESLGNKQKFDEARELLNNKVKYQGPKTKKKYDPNAIQEEPE